MNERKNFISLMSVVISLAAIIVITFPVFADGEYNTNYYVEEQDNVLRDLDVEIFDGGQYVTKDEQGNIVLDGATKISLNLSNLYQEKLSFYVAYFDAPEVNITPAQEATVGEIIDFSNILENENAKYLIKIYAEKVGYDNFEYEGTIIMNIEKLKPSLLFIGSENKTNPSRIILSADKNATFNWKILNTNTNESVIGVGQDALDIELLSLANGSYEITNKAILTTQYNNSFEFEVIDNFSINKIGSLT